MISSNQIFLSTKKFTIFPKISQKKILKYFLKNSKITFNAVENAVKYEFYVKRADGNFSLIDNFTVNDDGAETYTVNFTSNHLSAGVYEVAVRAVGDKMAGYFKSPLPNLSTSVVTVVID